MVSTKNRAWGLKQMQVLPPPTGDRSRTGIVVYWRGNLIFSHSSNQSMATLSTAEAEMGATVPGLKYGLAIHHFLMGVEPESSEGVQKIH